MDERIKLVLDHIANNLNAQLSLAELAAVACLSPSQFHRRFKKTTRCTPFKFIEQAKMNKAYQRLIHEEQVKVRQLTTDLGYQDYETFSRAFKKHFHLSPDDLKAIILKLKQQSCLSEEHRIYVSTQIDIHDHPALLDRVKAILNDEKISKSDLRETQIFKIVAKPADDVQPAQLIKNKFAIFEEKRIWESLLKQL